MTRVHSPAPWSVETTDANGWKGLSIKDADGVWIANLVFQHGDNERANARVMIAAPDLLEAARLALAYVSNSLGDAREIEAGLRDAIAKAEPR